MRYTEEFYLAGGRGSARHNVLAGLNQLEHLSTSLLRTCCSDRCLNFLYFFRWR